MKLKPILETGEQIYNYLQNHFEYVESSFKPMESEFVPIFAKPQVIILPTEEGQLLLKYLSEIGKLTLVNSDVGELETLSKLWDCDVYVSGYTTEIEIF